VSVQPAQSESVAAGISQHGGKMTFPDIKDSVDIASKLVLPFVLAWVGLLLVRDIEVRKAGVGRSSEFKQKWADSFYDTSHEFMQSTERYMAVLKQLQGMANANSTFGTKLQEELNDLNVRLGELGLRIQRFAYYAPSKGHEAIRASTAVHAYLHQMMTNLQGSFDQLIALQNAFNRAVREAHAEMLEIQGN
jgi:hypothetical protein